MTNLIVILLLIIAIGILTFNQRPDTSGGYTASQNAQLTAAYKNKADAFEALNSALQQHVEEQNNLLEERKKLLDIYRAKYGNQ